MKKRKPETILVVDDEPVNLDVLTHTLEPAGFQVLAVPNGEIALRVAERGQPDLILLDVVMPEVNGLEVCELLKKSPTTRDIPVLFLSGRGEMKTMVAGLKAGAVDYLTKPFNGDEILARIETHLKNRRLTRALQAKNLQLETQASELRAANEKLEAEMSLRQQAEQDLVAADERLHVLGEREAERWDVSGLVGQSPTLRRILNDVEKLRAFGATSVLITGESGTGKELIARAVHAKGPQAKGPFIPVNCVAVPSELAESMFFGHMRGSFTGAVNDRKGFFELAHQGTLFLDEIGDMPLSLQAKLLRVLEDGMVFPVGSDKGRKIDCRVVAATNAHLPERIAAGQFRQDLYFRLARFNVATPPLRDRLEDIPLLARHFVALFVKEMGRKPPPITDGAIRALQSYHFPGNIRELKNMVERALILSGGEPIEPAHLDMVFAQVPAARTLPSAPTTITSMTDPVLPVYRATAFAMSAPSATAEPSAAGLADLPLNLEEAETVLIRRALAQTKGNVAQAARLLGVHRTRIYRMMSANHDSAVESLTEA